MPALRAFLYLSLSLILPFPSLFCKVRLSNLLYLYYCSIVCARTFYLSCSVHLATVLVQHFAYWGNSHRNKVAASHIIDVTISLASPSEEEGGLLIVHKKTIPAFEAPIEEDGGESESHLVLCPVSICPFMKNPPALRLASLSFPPAFSTTSMSLLPFYSICMFSILSDHLHTSPTYSV